MTASVYYCGYTSMTLCEPTVQHFLLLAHSYSHRKGLSVCHNQTSVCSKTSTAPLETHSWDPCKQPAFCWVQFLQNGKLEARSPTPEFSSIHLSVKIGGFWKFPLSRYVCCISCHVFPLCKWLFVHSRSANWALFGTWCTSGIQNLISKVLWQIAC